jgi:hypothetical protein
MKTQWILAALLLLTFSACKTGREKSHATPSTTVTEPLAQEALGTDSQMENNTVWTREQAMQGPGSFRLVVSLISTGGGTDPQGKVLIDQYLADYKVKTGKQVVYIMIPWGREGEVDCCFSLSGLKESEQAEFIKGMQEAFKDRPLMQIEENRKNRFRD